MKRIRRLREIAVLAVVLLSTSIFTACGVLGFGIYAGQTGYGYDYENPQWAPPYYNGARYYYLPDIECYYDLSNRDFIYLNDGQWYYSQNIPSMYANFDLSNSFTVVLDVNVYQPWMHHQYYVSHYPRYYYRDYYDHSNFPYVRGFNENKRSAIYWSENERHRARNWDDENVRRSRNFNYSKEDRQQQQNWSNQGVRRNNQEFNRQPTDDRRQPVTTTQGDRNQKTNYYGKPIGNSVKVRKEMQNRDQVQNREQKQKADVKKNTEQKKNAEVKRNAEQKQKADQKKNEEKNKQKKESGSVYRR